MTRRTESILFWASCAALTVLVVWTVFAVPYLPTNDGPQTVFATHAINHYGDPGTIYADQLVPAPQFAYRGFRTFFDPLEAMLGWMNGLRAAIALSLVMLAWGGVALVLAVSPSRRGAALLAFPLALTWQLYMGFFAFGAATAIGLGLLAYAIARLRRNVTLGTRDLAILAVALLAEAVAHVFTAALTGVILAAVVVAVAPRDKRAAAFGRMALVGAPAALVLFASTRYQSLAQVAMQGSFRTIAWADRPVVLARILVPGPLWRSLLGALALLAALGSAAVRWRRGSLSAVERPLAAASLGLVVVAIVAPLDIPGWQFFSPRFLPMAAFLALATVPLEAARATVALFAVAAGSLVVSASFHRRLAAGCGDAIAGLFAPVHYRGFELPITLATTCGVDEEPTRSEVPFAAPLLHIGALYAVAHGGTTPYLMIGSPAVHAFTPRNGRLPPLPVPDIAHYWTAIATDEFKTDPAVRREVMNELATYGLAYASILVTGQRPDEVPFWTDRGYVVDWTRGSVLLGHFEPCRFDVVLPDGAPPAHVDVGTSAFPTVIAEAAGTGRVTLGRAPCGDIWVRPRELRCANADKNGRIFLHVDRTTREVACAPSP